MGNLKIQAKLKKSANYHELTIILWQRKKSPGDARFWKVAILVVWLRIPRIHFAHIWSRVCTNPLTKKILNSIRCNYLLTSGIIPRILIYMGRASPQLLVLGTVMDIACIAYSMLKELHNSKDLKKCLIIIALSIISAILSMASAAGIL